MLLIRSSRNFYSNLGSLFRASNNIQKLPAPKDSNVDLFDIFSLIRRDPSSFKVQDWRDLMEGLSKLPESILKNKDYVKFIDSVIRSDLNLLLRWLAPKYDRPICHFSPLLNKMAFESLVGKLTPQHYHFLLALCDNTEVYTSLLIMQEMLSHNVVPFNIQVRTQLANCLLRRNIKMFYIMWEMLENIKAISADTAFHLLHICSEREEKVIIKFIKNNFKLESIQSIVKSSIEKEEKKKKLNLYYEFLLPSSYDHLKMFHHFVDIGWVEGAIKEWKHLKKPYSSMTAWAYVKVCVENGRMNTIDDLLSSLDLKIYTLSQLEAIVRVNLWNGTFSKWLDQHRLILTNAQNQLIGKIVAECEKKVIELFLNNHPTLKSHIIHGLAVADKFDVIDEIFKGELSTDNMEIKLGLSIYRKDAIELDENCYNNMSSSILMKLIKYFAWSGHLVKACHVAISLKERNLEINLQR